MATTATGGRGVPVIPAGAWVLAIDFGTTNTVAAWGDGGGVRPLNINGRTIMPSAVVLQSQRLGRPQWLVGEHAINAAQARMGSFEQHPKSCIPDGTVLLAGGPSRWSMWWRRCCGRSWRRRTGSAAPVPRPGSW